MTTADGDVVTPTAPRPNGLAASAAAFPPLQGGAMPVAQDRWERLVSTTMAPYPLDQVWEALTDPERVRHWLAVCRGQWATAGAECMLDFEDGEFFWCRTLDASPPAGGRPGTLRYLWRWVGIGPATSVTWTLAPAGQATAVTVVEEAENPPSDWRSWNGMGWPGILDQLVAHIRTGTGWRWPWRRMGPYIQIPLPAPAYQAWEALMNPGAVKHWLQRTHGSLDPDDELTLVMGDASGTVHMRVTRVVDAGQSFPSYLPSLEFELRRPSWATPLNGFIWIEPTGVGSSLLQVFHQGWEALDIPEPVTERRLLTNFWVSAAGRAMMLFMPPGGPPMGPHGWSVGAGPQAAGNGSGDGAGQFPGAGGPGGFDPGAGGPAGAMAGPGGMGAGGMGAGGPGGPGGDMAAAQQFLGRVLGDVSGAMTSIMCALGARLGLFAELGREGPATSTELAERTGLAERYLREWLRCLASAAYLEHDASTDRFALPTAHAGALAFEGSPFCMVGGYELLLPMAEAVEVVAEAFHTGEGIPHDRYPQKLFEAMEQMSASWLDTMLVQQWIPAVPGLAEALTEGGTVVDVGCGGGRALVVLAEAFPRARLHGYDTYEPNVQRARASAERAGVAERVRVDHAEAADAMPDGADLVTMFDVLHDAPDPEGLLAAARRALSTRNGVLLVLEGRAADDPAANAGPAATVLYATSTLYCVPTALADGAPGLGTLGLPPARLRQYADAAGFSDVQEVPVPSPFNALYALRP